MGKSMEKMKSGLSKVMGFIDKTISPVMTKVGQNRYMQSIRNGIVSAIPMILVGSIFCVIYFFPISNGTTAGVAANFGSWVLNYSGHSEWASFILLPYRLTFAMMGFFVVLGVARALSEYYKLDSQQASFMAIIVYLLSIAAPSYTGVGNATFVSGTFGASSIFGGVVIALLCVEFFRLCVQYRITIRLPKQVPQVVAKPFAAVIPLLLVLIPTLLLFLILKFDIHSFMSNLFAPLQNFFAGNNIGGALLIIFLIVLLWYAGISGDSIILSIARPFLTISIVANAAIVAGDDFAGNILYYNAANVAAGASIVTEPFFQWFVSIGGSGATVGLIISMWFVGRSKYGKSITSASTVPAIFNINEPVIFGFPIMLNPLFLIPFILSPLLMGLVAYIVIYLGLVGMPVLVSAWTLPGPIGVFFSTLDWKSIILVIFLILLSTLIWLPFAIIYDKQQLQTELSTDVEERINQLKEQGVTDIDEKAIYDELRRKQKKSAKPLFISIFQRKEKNVNA